MKTKLTKFFKKYWLVILSLVISFVIFFPAFSSFFTNDDFYFLKISKIENVSQFISFFDPVHDPLYIGVYRPLPLRVYYFLGTFVFNLNPLGLRIISFVTFILDILLVGYLVKLLTKNDKISAISVFLYAVSVTHFGQLYYIGAFQELLITLLTLLSVIFFAKSRILLSFLLFVIALMCKETAVVIPVLLVAVYVFQNLGKKKKLFPRELIKQLVPFLLILFLYLYLHFFLFGTIEGDSYVWDFSPTRALNTVFWYLLWSLNLPEMLVDFVGPGLHLNPNLFKFWSPQIIPILALFGMEVFIIASAFTKDIKSKTSNIKSIVLFSGFWFLATILPVAFLPVHKFTYYLTLPLFGIVLLLSYLIQDSRLKIPFCVVWLTISLFSLRLTLDTNWITQGAKISERVYTYFKENNMNFEGKTMTFVDTAGDESLPWSPTETVKTVISDHNFFDLFYPNLSKNISYDGEGDIKIISRQFLGY